MIIAIGVDMSVHMIKSNWTTGLNMLNGKL